MKKFLFVFLFIIPQVCFSFTNEDKCCSKKNAAKCTGSLSCKACSNCNACKWCTTGGTCGVCALAKKKLSKSNPNSSVNNPSDAKYYTGQCMAITKKGARCKRTANKNGYCWQHGG